MAPEDVAACLAFEIQRSYSKPSKVARVVVMPKEGTL